MFIHLTVLMNSYCTNFISFLGNYETNCIGGGKRPKPGWATNTNRLLNHTNDLLAMTLTLNPCFLSTGSPTAKAWHSYLPSAPYELSSFSVIFRVSMVTKSFGNLLPPRKERVNFGASWKQLTVLFVVYIKKQFLKKFLICLFNSFHRRVLKSMILFHRNFALTKFRKFCFWLNEIFICLLKESSRCELWTS